MTNYERIMTKDLSRQLCELVGLKPVYTIIINVGDFDTYYQKLIYKSKFALLRAHFDDFNEYYRKHNPDWEDEDYCINFSDIKEEFVNFETPENFVKLLQEIQNLRKTTISLLYNSNCKSVTKEFICQVIALLKGGCSCLSAPNSDWTLDKLKQALQAQDFKY